MFAMKKTLALTFGSAILLASSTFVIVAQSSRKASDDAQRTIDNSILPSEHAAIDYFDAPTTDPVGRLNRQLANGEVKLEYRNDGRGYLTSLLEKLHINPDSQVLVFSKTSFQAVRISPHAPRALYFNDVTTVGFVQNSEVLELASLDPRQGYIFYTLDNTKPVPESPTGGQIKRQAAATHPPTMDRRDICLQCHQGPATSGVPGIMVASVYPDASGMPYARLGMPVTDHRTPFQDRWGGWYVSGTHGGMFHRGNAVSRNRESPAELEIKDTQNLTDLSRKFDPKPYLTAISDVVALMTLEHQTRMTNLITRVGWEARIAAADHATDEATNEQMDRLVRYMLFTDEARLVDTVAGVSTFAKTFPQRGPKDRRGRSLRDFDLKTRLFRYPLSYMIYSEAFDAMPQVVRDEIYRRLYSVLSGQDQRPEYQTLSAADRKAIVEIVKDTKLGLPTYWKPLEAGL